MAGQAFKEQHACLKQTETWRNGRGEKERESVCVRVCERRGGMGERGGSHTHAHIVCLFYTNLHTHLLLLRQQQVDAGAQDACRCWLGWAAKRREIHISDSSIQRAPENCSLSLHHAQPSSRSRGLCRLLAHARGRHPRHYSWGPQKQRAGPQLSPPH